MLQGLVTDDYESSFGQYRVVPGIRRNVFSDMTAAKKGLPTIFDYENPSLEGFNVTVPLRSASGDLYSFVLDLSADRYGTKELAMNAVANARMWHRRLGYLHAQILDILCKQDGTGTHSRGLSRTVTFAPCGTLNSLRTSRQPTTRSTGLFSCDTRT